MAGENQIEGVQVDRSSAKRRLHYWYFAMFSVSGLVLSVLLVLWCKPWLNESERRLLGVWTWKDQPGEITIHYRDDGTMRYTDRPGDRDPAFVRWSIESNVISEEFSERNTLEYVAKNLLFRRKWKPDQHGIMFNADGTVTVKLWDGTDRVMIPWSSDQGEFLKNAR